MTSRRISRRSIACFRTCGCRRSRCRRSATRATIRSIRPRASTSAAYGQLAARTRSAARSASSSRSSARLRSIWFRSRSASCSPATRFWGWRRVSRSRTILDPTTASPTAPAAERALLRRRRYDDARVCPRPARRAAHSVAAVKTRSTSTAFRWAATPNGAVQRRAAGAAWRGMSRFTAFSTPATCSERDRTSNSANSARRSDSACYISRPSDRCGSIWDSRCIRLLGRKPDGVLHHIRAGVLMRSRIAGLQDCRIA